MSTANALTTGIKALPLAALVVHQRHKKFGAFVLEHRRKSAAICGHTVQCFYLDGFGVLIWDIRSAFL
jgi:hypothetical protein